MLAHIMSYSCCFIFIIEPKEDEAELSDDGKKFIFKSGQMQICSFNSHFMEVLITTLNTSL